MDDETPTWSTATGDPLPSWIDVALELIGARARGAAPLPTVAARASASCAELRRHKIDSLYYLAFAPDAAAQRLYDKYWQAQRVAAQELVAEAARGGIRPLLFKGGELVAALFGGRALGMLADIDLLVPATDLGQMKRILYRGGYVYGRFVPEERRWHDYDVHAIAQLELGHIELAPFVRLVPLALDEEELAFARTIALYPGGDPNRVGGPALYILDDVCHALIKADVHHGIERGIDVTPLLARAVPSTLTGAVTFTAADHLWFTVKRHYGEVALGQETSLRPLAVAAALLARREIDWDIVLRAAREQRGAAPALHHWLTLLDRVGGGGLVPDAVHAELAPRGVAREGDWGWQLAKLFGTVDPFPYHRRSVARVVVDAAIG